MKGFYNIITELCLLLVFCIVLKFQYSAYARYAGAGNFLIYGYKIIMFMKLFFLFTVVPFIEIYILIKIGGYFGLFTTLFIIIGTGLIGAHFVKQEGFKVWIRIRNEMNNGNFPANDLVEGLLLFIAGVILITPGLLTDIMGLVILIPFIRNYMRVWINRKFSEMVEKGDVRFIRFMQLKKVFGRLPNKEQNSLLGKRLNNMELLA